MKKLILFLSILLMVSTLIACTSDKETKKEIVQETKNEVIYEVPNNSWDISPAFEHSIIDKDGKEFIYTIVGNKETLGFTGDIEMNVEKTHKIFWFYFGKENIYDKPVEVKAIKKGTEKLVDLHSGSFYKGAEVSADSVNMPSNLKFPSSGTWKLLVYIDGKFYESIVVEIE